MIKNEVVASKKISAMNPSIITDLYDFLLNKYLPINYCVFEFLTDYIPLSQVQDLSNKDLKNLCSALDIIVDTLEVLAIKHRDITPSNLFVKGDDFTEIIIIDFAMADGDSMSPLKFIFLNRLVLHSLGGGYRPSKNKWDDRYSVNLIVDYFKREVIND